MEDEQKNEKEKGIISLRFGLFLSLVLGILVAVINCCSNEASIGMGLFSGYAVFAFGVHMGKDCFIFDLFTDAWSTSFRMPGIIFSLDLDGILFLLAYKLCIAPLLSLALTCIIGCLGTLLAFVLAIFSFPIQVLKALF